MSRLTSHLLTGTLAALLVLGACALPERWAWRPTPETCAIDTVTADWVHQEEMRKMGRRWDCLHTPGAVDSLTRAALKRWDQRKTGRRP